MALLCGPSGLSGWGVAIGATDDRISLCRSSNSEISSSSERSPVSNVSDKVRSTVGESILERIRCRDASEDARERKEGGGELGIVLCDSACS